MQSSLIFWLLIGIILILAYELFVPTITGNGGGQSSRNAALADIRGGIKTALDRYKIDNDSFPKSFNDLVQNPGDVKHWSGPYLDALPADPWGDKYIYEFPGKHNPNSYDLISAGPDGKEGTDDDIGNWMTLQLVK